MPFNIGAPELIIILIIALLVLGPGKLPEVGSALGKSIREFRKATSDIQESVRIDTSPTQPAPVQQPPAVAQPQPVAQVPAPNQIGQPGVPNTLSQPSQASEPVEAPRS